MAEQSMCLQEAEEVIEDFIVVFSCFRNATDEIRTEITVETVASKEGVSCFGCDGLARGKKLCHPMKGLSGRSKGNVVKWEKKVFAIYDHNHDHGV